MTIPNTIMRLASSGMLETQDESRVVTFVLSDSSVARDGHTLAADGWDITSYLKNPVVLFAHDAESLDCVIGRMANIRVRGNQLVGDVEFMPEYLNPMAETVYQMVKQRFLNAVSVGFIPLDGKPAKGRGAGAYDFSKQELLEVSVVPVPALPTALAEARAAGINTDIVRAWAKRIMETPDMTVPAKEEIELPAERDAPKIKMKRGLQDVGWLASLLGDLSCLEEWIEWEAECEGDDSPIPQMLSDALKTLGGILIAMTVEEVGELLKEETSERATDTPGKRAVKQLARVNGGQDVSQKRFLIETDTKMSPDAQMKLASSIRAWRRNPELILVIDPGIRLREVSLSDGTINSPIVRAGKTISADTERCLRDAHDRITQAGDMLMGVITPADPDEDDTDAVARALANGDQTARSAEEGKRRSRRLMALQAFNSLQ